MMGWAIVRVVQFPQIPVPPDPSYWWEPYGAPDLPSFLIGLVAVAFALIVALAQFFIMRRQTELMEKQDALNTRQEQYFQEQLQKKSKLSIRVKDQGRVGNHIEAHIEVHNAGNNTADGFYWDLYFDRAMQGHVRVAAAGSQRLVQIELEHFPSGQWLYSSGGHYRDKLYADTAVDICRFVIVDPTSADMQDFILKWRLKCEDGTLPTEGLYGIRFETNQGFYRNTYLPAEPV